MMSQEVLTLFALLAAYLGVTLVVSTDLSELPVQGPMEFCEFDTFQPSCAPGEIIIIRAASYGRMKLGKCVTADLGYVGCRADVLDLVDAMCSGRRTCTIAVPNQALAARSTCMNELKLYLEVSYSCLKVATTNPAGCQRCDHVRLSASSGYLASDTTVETGCGGVDCPWLIKASTGQVVDLTLYNFARKSSSDNLYLGESCRVVATVRDVSSGKTTTICASAARIQHVFKSPSNVVELRLVDRSQEYFVIRYQSSGCDQQLLPPGITLAKVGDGLNFVCNYTGVSWRIECRQGQWQPLDGSVRCELPVKGDELRALTSIGGMDHFSISQGLFVTIMASIAIVVSTLVIVAGVIAYRRRKSANNKATNLAASIYFPAKQTPRADGLTDYTLPTERHYLPSDYYVPEQTVTASHRLGGGGGFNAKSRSATNPRVDDGYMHIWERPLPDPKKAQSVAQTYQRTTRNQPSIITGSSGYTVRLNDINTAERGNRGQCLGQEIYDELSLTDEEINQRYFQLEPEMSRRHKV